MNCEAAKQHFVDYLYREIGDEQKQQFEAHLADCECCRREIAALKGTTAILQKWEEIDPKLNLIFVKESVSGWQRVIEKARALIPGRQNWGKRFAYGFAVALILLSLANLNISWQDGIFHLKMSLLPQSNKTHVPTEAVSRDELLAFQNDQIALMNQLIEASEARQRRDMVVSLTDFAQEIANQRRSDMAIVGTSFEQLQYLTNRRLERTSQSVNGLIKVMQTRSKPSGQK
ncbi:zf-HC2 domain-containing protein [candidate division KSB1 bacterium]|nr:zf-HC2 domain-containing protein [candidate division KSB1 bacterium]